MKIQIKPSTISLHFEKHERSDMLGMGRHVERKKFENHSNKRIDNTKSNDNIYLIDRRSEGSYTERFDKAINDHYKGKRRVRKDAVTMISATVNLGGYIAKDCTLDEQVAVLTEAFNYLVKVKGKFEDENILSAVIHVDETTPHVHFDFVPLTDDGRLSAKELMTQSSLIKDQNGLLRHLQDKFPKMKFLRQDQSQKLLKDGETLENRILASELYGTYCEQVVDDVKAEMEEVFEGVRGLADALRSEISKNKEKGRTLSDQLKAVDKSASELTEKESKFEEKMIFEVLKLKQKKGELEEKEQELDAERSRLDLLKEEQEKESTVLSEIKHDLKEKEQELDAERSRLDLLKEEQEKESTVLSEIKHDLKGKEQELDAERSRLDLLKEEQEKESIVLSEIKHDLKEKEQELDDERSRLDLIQEKQKESLIWMNEFKNSLKTKEENLKLYFQKIKEDLNVIIQQGFKKLKKASEIVDKKEYQPLEEHAEEIHKDLTALIENPLDFSDFEDLNTAEEMSL